MSQTRSSVEESTLRILVATDNHLGYMEKDPIRGEDSFVTFEEILQIANKEQADMVLLGGDLFHDNKPSRSTLYKTMEILRRYCMGDRPIQFRLLSDQSINFKDKFATVNYEDPNYNISMPIFSIHGNHDDPSGEGGLAALDLLSVCNLLNYFGKSENVDDVTVYPLLFGKGETRTAVYGLGNIRDERLYRTFQQKKVKLMRPVEEKEKWFNIFVLHQNRVAHSPKNYVHEVMLDNFLDLVIWGHEHECLIQPQDSSVGEFYVTQPGSSVATSLSEGESKKKHVGLLEIHKEEFRLKPIALNTVRPFVMASIVLSDEPELEGADPATVMDYLERKVQSLIEEAEKEYPPARGQKPLMPLIRLKVDYSGGFSTCNPLRFGQRFVGKLANPNDILLFHKKRSARTATAPKIQADDAQAKSKLLRPDPLDKTKIEDLICNLLSASENMLEILPEEDLNVALQNFVQKDEKSAIEEFVKKTLHNTQQLLVKEDPSKTTQPDFIHTLVTEHTAQLRERFLRDRATNDDGDYDMKQDSDGDSKSDVKGKGKDTKPKDEEEDFATDYNFADDDDDDTVQAKDSKKRGRSDSSSSQKPKRGRGSGSGSSASSSGSSGRGRGRGRGRGKAADNNNNNNNSGNKYSLDVFFGNNNSNKSVPNDDEDDDNDNLDDNRGLKKIKTEIRDDDSDDAHTVATPSKSSASSSAASTPAKGSAKKSPTNKNTQDNDNDSDNDNRTSSTTPSPKAPAATNWGKRRNPSNFNN